ncbi:MAG: DUF4340 domain-containing protein [Acidobacteria bacterium]|nr:DUF4340 domain-containing protein [Acidobacteriota bacterium]
MKKLILLLVLFSGLALFVYFYEIKGGKEREQAKEAEAKLFNVKQDQISGLEVIRSNQPAISLKKEGERWRVASPVQAKADTTTVESLLSSIASARIDRSFDLPKNQDPYGLKSPRLRLKVVSGKVTRTLSVGADDYTGNSIYVQFQGEAKAHLTSDMLLTNADKEILQWRDRKILDFQREQVRNIEIKRPTENINLTKRGDLWMLQSPYQEATDDGTLSTLLSTLEFAEAQSFVSEKAEDLKPFGLQPAELTVRIEESIPGKWKILEIGKKENGSYFAHNPELSPVFTVKDEIRQKLSQSVWEFRDKDIMNVPIDQVSEFQMTRGNEEFVIRQSDVKWTIQEPASHQGKEALTYKFWYPIDDLRFESIVQPAGAFPKADVRIVLKLRSGGSRTFEFAQQGELYLARRVENDRRGTISEDSFKKLQFKVEEII